MKQGRSLKTGLTTKQLTCKLGWQPSSNNVLTTPIWPLLTPICNGVCLRLFLAFRSAPPLWSCSTTLGSSPKAAWCIALSPSLSYNLNVAMFDKSKKPKFEK